MALWQQGARSSVAFGAMGLFLLSLKLAEVSLAFTFYRPAGSKLAPSSTTAQNRVARLSGEPVTSSIAGVGTSSLIVACFALAAVRTRASHAVHLRPGGKSCTMRNGRIRLAAAGADGSPFRVLVPVANDSEEIETACITDVLTRAGAEVTVASVEPELQVRMSRGLKVVADKLIGDCAGEQWDAIACPGGMPGAERLRDSEDLTKLLTEQRSSGRVTAAVCASPAVIFATHGLIGDTATSYPAPKFKELVGEGWTDAKAVVDGNVITSQGPGTSLQFALKIVEELYGIAKAKELADQLITRVA
mmetsp:Transcript_29532/g.84575  ORF Transcript_29532/g.84575 Transcript_29532/m.84575 type:complete len:304 (+) Transcript_29532:80-991(+)